MWIILLITLLVAATAFAEVDEKGVNTMYKVFCDEDLAKIKTQIMECFEGMEIDQEDERITVDCCEGIEEPITYEAMISWVCAHKPEEFMQSAVCSEKKLEEAGNKEKYTEAMQQIDECLKKKLAKPEEDK